MRLLAMVGLLCVGSIVSAQPPVVVAGDGWEARIRGGNGVQLRVSGVLLSRGSWVQLAAPDWSTGYYSSQGTPTTPEREGDTLILRHAVSPDLGTLIETLRKTAPDTLEWQLEAEWRSEKPAIVEWCLGLWNAEYLLGATLSGDGELATETLTREPKTFPAERLFSGTRIALNSRVADLELQAEPLSILDGRGSARWWSREVPTLWAGVLAQPLRRGERIQITARLRLAPKPLSPQGAPLEIPASIETVADRWAPTPREPELLPPPKILWRGTGEPFRLPAEQVAHIHIEDETYRSAAEALAREWKRYGLRTRIQIGAPQAGVVFIGGSPDLQRKHPVPDQQGAYYLEVNRAGAKVIGRLQEGAFYGVQTLMQWFQPDSGALVAAPVHIIDYPHLKWRGVHLFGSTQPDFLPRLIENVIAHAKFNQLVLECGYGQWEAIRDAWVDISAPKPLLRAAVQTARKNQIEPIPLIQSLGHMSWVFRNDAHKHLAEDPDTPWALAPRNPETRLFLQRLYDEVFEVFQPHHFHIGLDEVAQRGRFPNRPESQGATVAELFVEHAEWVHSEMKRRGIEKVLMWGDMLLAPGEANDGGAHAPSIQDAQFIRERLSKLKDIVICDWHYTPTEPENYISLPILQSAGFREIIATTWFHPRNIASFAKAARQRRITGLLQSTWAGYTLNERTLQGQELRQFVAYLIAAAYAWDTDLPMPDELSYDFERLFIERYYHEPIALHARGGFVVNLVPWTNYDLSQLSLLWTELPVGTAHLNGHRFALSGARGVMLASYLAPESLPKAVRLPLNRPVNTLYLLHTTAWQTEIGSEVGRIVVEYADGTQSEQTVVYGRHIRAWNDRLYALEGLPLWRARGAKGEIATARLLKWHNPHPQKIVRAVRFVASDPVAGWTLLGLSGE
ncbi:MAG: hypothetical protein D6697_11260 [Armatimonadetes bacterium]|nr:MAG: hypothetical protein D6697_11260 [Armatimonadota bacterium]